MNETLHYLVNMPNPSIKQTLCVMPDMEERLAKEEDIVNGMFFIINGQHSVGASINMQTSSLPPKPIQPFTSWNCFIVWSKKKTRLRQILGYYNRCNHFSIFKPTWTTNVLGARFI
jgi:hypothetical protein